MAKRDREVIALVLPLCLAAEVIASGRVEDPSSWEKMKEELLIVCDEEGYSDTQTQEVLEKVKDYWY